MQRCRTVISALALLLFLFPPAGRCVAADQPTHIALVLVSLQQGVPWTDRIMSGLETKLLSTDKDLELQIDYMHTSRLGPDPRLFSSLYKVYKREFGSVRFDAVIAVGDNALAFLLKHGDSIFPHTPVIFVASQTLSQAAVRRPLYKGVTMTDTLRDAFSLAGRLFPGTRGVFCVGDGSYQGGLLMADARRIAEAFPRLDTQFLTPATLEELLVRLRNLPPQSVVVSFGYTLDQSGRFYPGMQPFRDIASASSAPVIGIWDFQLDAEILGGRLIDTRKVGVLLGDAALRIISGRRIQDMRLPSRVPSRYVFNYKQLRRFGVPT